MRLRLGGCLYAHTGELQNKCFAEFILLWSFHSLMTELFVETIAGRYVIVNGVFSMCAQGSSLYFFCFIPLF